MRTGRSRRRLHARAACAILIGLLATASAKAQTSASSLRSTTEAASSLPPSASAGPEGADARADERIAFIQARLALRAPALNRWWFGWIAIYSTLTVAQGVIAAGFSDPQLRFPAIVGGASSLVGLAGVLTLPPSGRTASGRLERVTHDPTLDRAAQVQRAERLLRESASDEAFGHSWLAYSAAVVVPAIGSAVLWFAFNQPWTALANFLVGVPVGMAQIATTPFAARTDVREYERRFGGGTNAPHVATTSGPRVRVYALPLGVGIAF